jgi:hypothetical protein
MCAARVRARPSGSNPLGPGALPPPPAARSSDLRDDRPRPPAGRRVCATPHSDRTAGRAREQERQSCPDRPGSERWRCALGCGRRGACRRGARGRGEAGGWRVSGRERGSRRGRHSRSRPHRWAPALLPRRRRRAGGWPAASGRQELKRIDVALWVAGAADAEVHAGVDSRAAGGADARTGVHVRAAADVDAGQREDARAPRRAGDRDDAARRADSRGDDDAAGAWRADGRARRGGEVGASVPTRGERATVEVVRARHAAPNRPRPRRRDGGCRYRQAEHEQHGCGECKEQEDDGLARHGGDVTGAPPGDRPAGVNWHEIVAMSARRKRREGRSVQLALA